MAQRLSKKRKNGLPLFSIKNPWDSSWLDPQLGAILIPWLLHTDFTEETQDARGTSEEPDTHFEIKHPDTMVLMATVSGSRARRNNIIPLFAEHLKNSSTDEDLYEVFLKTNRDIEMQESTQVAEFWATFKYWLCLHILCPWGNGTRAAIPRSLAVYLTIQLYSTSPILSKSLYILFYHLWRRPSVLVVCHHRLLCVEGEPLNTV